MVMRVALVAVVATLLVAAGCSGRSTRRGGALQAGGSGSGGRGETVTGGRTGAFGAGGIAAGPQGGLGGDEQMPDGGTAGGGGDVPGSSGRAGEDGGGGTTNGAGRSAGGLGGSGGSPGNAGSPVGGAPGGDGPGGESGAGGEGAVGGFPPRPLCGTLYPPNAAKCEGLEQVAISAAPVLDADGNEGISPGEDASVVITLHNTSDDTFESPCVGLLADDPSVSELRGQSGTSNPWTNYFGIGADQHLDFKMRFHLDDGVAPGTRIHFVAWVTMQNAGCANGEEIGFTLAVAP